MKVLRIRHNASTIVLRLLERYSRLNLSENLNMRIAS
jgi:hypothetical protein